jgi:hypothetical protein
MVEPAVLIARLVGPVFLAIGLGTLINAGFYVGAIQEGAHSPTLVYLSGVASLLAGLAILNAYRAWTGNWRVIVTIIGWLCAIGGVIRIVVPRAIEGAATTIYSGTTALMIVGIIVLIVGAYLSYESYHRA